MIEPKIVRGLMVLVGLGAVQLLQRKNEAYGNSALDPVRVFSKASAEEQILVRLDDKLSRLKRGEDAGEDVMFDLFGYLLLYRVAVVYRALDDAHRQNMTGGEVPDDRVCRVLTTLGLRPVLVRHLVEKVDLSGVSGLFAHLETMGTQAVPLAVECPVQAPAPDMADVMQHLETVAPDLLKGAESFDMQVQLLKADRENIQECRLNLAAEKTKLQGVVESLKRELSDVWGSVKRMEGLQSSQAEALRNLEEENGRLRSAAKVPDRAHSITDQEVQEALGVCRLIRSVLQAQDPSTFKGPMTTREMVERAGQLLADIRHEVTGGAEYRVTPLLSLVNKIKMLVKLDLQSS